MGVAKQAEVEVCRPFGQATRHTVSSGRSLYLMDWDDEILGIMGIPRQMLPKIVPSSDPNTWGNTLADGYGGCLRG